MYNYMYNYMFPLKIKYYDEKKPLQKILQQKNPLIYVWLKMEIDKIIFLFHLN